MPIRQYPAPLVPLVPLVLGALTLRFPDLPARLARLDRPGWMGAGSLTPPVGITVAGLSSTQTEHLKTPANAAQHYLLGERHD